MLFLQHLFAAQNWSEVGSLELQSTVKSLKTILSVSSLKEETCYLVAICLELSVKNILKLELLKFPLSSVFATSPETCNTESRPYLGEHSVNLYNYPGYVSNAFQGSTTESHWNYYSISILDFKIVSCTRNPSFHHGNTKSWGILQLRTVSWYKRT